MKILITGGAGFIGIHTARHFEKRQIHIVHPLSRRGAASIRDTGAVEGINARVPEQPR